MADEYCAVTDQVDALYEQSRPLPADAIVPKMARSLREHHRLLGNEAVPELLVDMSKAVPSRSSGRSAAGPYEEPLSEHLRPRR